MKERIWNERRRRLAVRGFLYPLALSLAILSLGGLGFWLIDPKVNSFSDGLWLAFTTAATVGYGDLVPSTSVSRVFSVLVVLMGLAVLSMVTASLAALLVESEEELLDKDLSAQLKEIRQELVRLRAQIEQHPLASRAPENKP
jgi:voltage-gated potassium channel